MSTCETAYGKRLVGFVVGNPGARDGCGVGLIVDCGVVLGPLSVNYAHVPCEGACACPVL